jgi:hypothetical protein
VLVDAASRNASSSKADVGTLAAVRAASQVECFVSRITSKISSARIGRNSPSRCPARNAASEQFFARRRSAGSAHDMNEFPSWLMAVVLMVAEARWFVACLNELVQDARECVDVAAANEKVQIVCPRPDRSTWHCFPMAVGNAFGPSASVSTNEGSADT